jgi:FkbM family methyltransferase
MYSQNSEDTLALDYFNHRQGASQIKTLLDIGANDGVTFSNSKFLIENGWVGFLLEPSQIAYQKCIENHRNNTENTFVYNFGIANETGEQEFLESASHLPNGKDIALLSSVPSRLTDRWRNLVDFKESKAMFYTFADFEKYFVMEGEKFTYISIDAEGYDWEILKREWKRGNRGILSGFRHAPNVPRCSPHGIVPWENVCRFRLCLPL